LYETGNGGIVVRANSQIERVVVGRSKQTRSAIVVTSLPFQVNKAALLEKLALLVNDKKLEGIADLRDESDRDGIRVVIELKRDAAAAVVLVCLWFVKVSFTVLMYRENDSHSYVSFFASEQSI
jgi:DNA gyrase subunit A